MEKIALDTNIAIAILNGNGQILNVIAQYDVLCLPITVCGELLFGAKNGKNAKQNLLKYKEFIQNCEVIDTNDIVADIYADIRLELKKQGTPIPENDIWIAALCIANSLPLATLDNHFSNIKTLLTISTF